MTTRALRREFFSVMLVGLRVVWPIISGLLALITVLGLIVARIEGWSMQEGVYFAFVSGLTIGYGDFSPKSLLARVLAILIGICGVLLTAVIASIAVRALTAMGSDRASRT